MKTNKKKTKKFDAVKMMREIRNKISAETKDMSFEELKKYIAVKSEKSKLHPVAK
jgi:hypothetical protein